MIKMGDTFSSIITTKSEEDDDDDESDNKNNNNNDDIEKNIGENNLAGTSDENTRINNNNTIDIVSQQESKFYFRRIKFSLPGLENAAVIQITESEYLSKSGNNERSVNENDTEAQNNYTKGIIENPIHLNALNADTTTVFIDSTSDIINFFNERSIGLQEVDDPSTGTKWYIATVTHLKWFDEIRVIDVKKTSQIIPYIERQAVRERHGINVNDKKPDRLSVDDEPSTSTDTSIGTTTSSTINNNKIEYENGDSGNSATKTLVAESTVDNGEYFMRTLEMYQFIQSLNTPILLEQLSQLKNTQNRLTKDVNFLFNQLDERIKKFHGLEIDTETVGEGEYSELTNTTIPFIVYPPLFTYNEYGYVPFDANAYNSQDMIRITENYQMEHQQHHQQEQERQQQQQQHELIQIKTESIDQNKASGKVVDATALDKEKGKQKELSESLNTQLKVERDTTFDNQLQVPHTVPLSNVPTNIQTKQNKIRNLFKNNPDTKKMNMGKKE